jgi:hypothetical protein
MLTRVYASRDQISGIQQYIVTTSRATPDELRAMSLGKCGEILRSRLRDRP